MKGHPVHYATLAVVVGAAFCLVMLAVVHPDTPGWVAVPALAVLAFVAILAAEHRRHRH